LIETTRLIIREFVPEDLNDLSLLLADEAVMHFSLTGPLSKERSAAFLEGCQNAYGQQGFSQYALTLKHTNQFIGFCGFFTPIINDKNEVELAYRVAKNFWGKGFATEAAIACKDYAFLELHIHKLISIIEPANIDSVKVAEKVGMRLEQKTIFHDIEVLIYALENPEID
jgi:RimJ/RimL family protein N-acetyltransferase